MAMSMPELVKKAREQISSLTGLEPSSTLGATKDEKGCHVTLEMIEKHSIPDGMDILAVYEVIMDSDDNLIEFSRKKLRKRIDTEEAGEE